MKMLIEILLVCSVLANNIGEEEVFDRVKMHIDLKIYVTGAITDVFE